jgi:hypothetical protein
MSLISLPKDFRPKNLVYRKLHLGLDLPAEFYQSIKGIDDSLYFVYHPVEVLYEDIMTHYTGRTDDPRWCINESYGQEIWGYPLTLPDGQFKPDETWHIWQLYRNVGWLHVSNIASREPSHLLRIIRRLGREKIFKARYGAFEWNHKMRQDDEDLEARKQDAKDQQFRDIQGENKAMTRKVMENLAMGITRPTNPTKDIIASYKGQTNFTKITRPITDTEGGLITGD